MIKIEDHCVGCPKELGCYGSACVYKNVPVLYCDECTDEVDELYKYEGYQICESCLLEKFEKVKID